MAKAVLGLKLNPWHDTGAAIVVEKDQELKVFAIAQERLDRRKNSRAFPRDAIEHCLRAAGLELRELEYVIADYICTPTVNDYADTNELEQTFKEHFFLQLETLKIPYFFIEHHLCHAACAFYASGFQTATCMVIDGLGSSYQTQSIYDCSKEGIKQIEVSRQPGVGLLYTFVTEKLLRFEHLQEGKTMGLAAWGDYIEPALEPFDFSAEYYNGINTPYTRFVQFLNDSPNIRYKLSEVFLSRELINASDTQPFASYARDAQVELEKCVAHLARYTKTCIPNNGNLCYSGGVALNIPANRILFDMNLFDNIYITPAASDTGIPLGAALYGYYNYAGGEKPYQMENAFLARTYDEQEIAEAVSLWNGPKVAGCMMDDIARLLNNNYILGWFQGSSEYGPRALGARSILCSPCHPEMKDHLNRQVKHREGFRPFAPVVSLEDQAKYFDSELESPYMLVNMSVQREWQEKIPAIVHVDGTARVQSVTNKRQPKLHQLLKTFEKYSGVPILLNTSYNIAGEPIVETPKDAVNRFAESNIDALVLGDWLLLKNEISRYIHPNNLETPRMPEVRQRWGCATMIDVLKMIKINMNKKVILFGTGSTSQRIYELLPFTFQYCVDNDLNRYNTLFNNLTVKPPQSLLEENKDELAIIIASQFHSEIASQLVDMGFIENIHFWNGFEILTAISKADSSLINPDTEVTVMLNQCLRELKKQQELADLRYRDLLELMKFKPRYIPSQLVEISHTSGVAIHSADHLYPRGTAVDNTRWPAFVIACEQHFGDTIAYLDLGCSGGGLVFDFAIRGHFAIGLEGSDYSLKRLRAEWRTIPDNLFTCDIAKPFTIRAKKEQAIKEFDVISAWDVLEHLSVEQLKTLLNNVTNHLADDGYFIGSVSTIADGPHHVTVQDENWWYQFFADNGFSDLAALAPFNFEDFPRGTGNINSAIDFSQYPELGFHFVLKKM